MENSIVAYRILVRGPVERGRLEDLGLDEWIILKWTFKKWDGEAWTGLLWLRIGTDDGRLWVPLGSIKCGEFLD
jgi:hypothetical protein